jgi:hypothetical protein
MDLLILAATTLVEAMSSDAWESAKKAVSAWWRRHRPNQAASVEEALESSCREVRSADDVHRERMISAIEGRWQGRLAALIEERPEVAGNLNNLVEQLRALLPAVDGAADVVNVNSGTVGGHLVQARDIHGDLQLGDVRTRKAPEQS